MPRFVVGLVAKRYVAGDDLEVAVSVMQNLGAKEGCSFTVDVLGEEISTMAEAQYFLDEYSRLVEAIAEHGLDANLSIKPTAFGLLIDEETAYSNIEKLLRKAAEHDIFVRLDMEDHRVTQATIDVALRMHEKGITNVGTVLQARLKRTPDDVRAISEALGPEADFRLCKGIYLEPEEIAHTNYHEINSSFSESLGLMLDSNAYVGIATHDKPVIHDALDQLRSRGMTPEGPDPREGAGGARTGKGPGYEFQMLLGIKGQMRRKLRRAGHPVRIYLPYGNKWYEYGMRRLRENPDVAVHITKAFLLPWTNRR
jgi:proline dehydrogenase